jgi:DNA-binding NtrC family response regulator
MLSKMLRAAPIEIEHVSSLEDVRKSLNQGTYGAILTEAYLPDGDWKDVLSFAWDLDAPPSVIVTHRFADDRFWAEVLNLGCYDMLAQPFDAREVQRILALACAQSPAKPAAYALPAKALLAS